MIWVSGMIPATDPGMDMTLIYDLCGLDRDLKKFSDLVALYWTEREDRTLNAEYYAWDGVGPCPGLKTPHYWAARDELQVELGSKYEYIASQYDAQTEA